MLSEHQIQLIKRLLIVSILTLIGFHLLGQFSAHILGHRQLLGFVAMFRLQSEHNAPAYYSGLQLVAAGVLLCLVARHAWQQSSQAALPWLGLGVMFFYLAVDEVFSIHEHFGTLGTSSSLYDILKYKWVITGIVLVIAIVALFFRFWLRLPSKTRFWFALSAMVYVGGAIGFETISGLYANQFNENFGFSLLVTAEEGMELIGIAMFIVAVARYMHLHCTPLESQPTPSTTTEPPTPADLDSQA